MSNGAVSGAAAAAAASAVANAQRQRQVAMAMGLVARVPEETFLSIAGRAEHPLVLTARMPGGWFRKDWYEHLTSYKGIGFCTRSAAPLTFGPHVEVIQVDRLTVPYV